MCYINNYILKIKKVLNFKKLSINLFKVYLDYDIVFYDISFDEIKTNFVYNKDDFYDDTIEGIPAYLKIPIGDTNAYFYYPDLDITKFNKGEEYAILTYKVRGAFSTKTVLLVLSMELDSIKVISMRKTVKVNH